MKHKHGREERHTEASVLFEMRLNARLRYKRTVRTWLQNGAAAGWCITWLRTLRQRSSGWPCLRALISAGDSAKGPPLRSGAEPCMLLCPSRRAAHERTKSVAECVFAGRLAAHAAAQVTDEPH